MCGVCVWVVCVWGVLCEFLGVSVWCVLLCVCVCVCGRVGLGVCALLTICSFIGHKRANGFVF